MSKWLNKMITLFMLVILPVVQAHALETRWYCTTCHAIRETQYCPDCGARNPYDDGGRKGHHLDPYDMGIPNLHGQTIKLDQMNLTVFWVQTQLKATGVYYQGDVWDVTGNLGDHTMLEIASFMQSRGYAGHNGQITQRVVDELADYLGCRLVPVYIGGFYRYMDNIMIGGHTGSMQPIISNLRDMVPHVTLGARWVQCCLKKLGYYSGMIDGMYGEATENAVKEFQIASGFEPRDYVTLGVARAMLEQCYYSGYSLHDML